jgi:hypothetical protein
MRLRRSDSIRYPRMGNARNSFGDGPSLGTDVVAITRDLRGCRCLGGILHFSLCQVARRPSVGVAPIKMIAASPSGPTGSASSRAWTSATTARMTSVHFFPKRNTFNPVPARAAVLAAVRGAELARLAELHNGCPSGWSSRRDTAGSAGPPVVEAGQRDRDKREVARTSRLASLARAPTRSTRSSRRNRGDNRHIRNRDDNRHTHRTDDHIPRNRSGRRDILRASLHHISSVHNVGRLSQLGVQSIGLPRRKPAHGPNG